MSYYHGLISSRRANSLLNQRPDGSFLIRDSQSQPGNFVLSAKCKGRMYHVLVFQQKGKYILDSVSDQEEIVEFSSLDDLILFLTGHNLKVGEDEVQLSDICSCADDSLRISSNSLSKVENEDDTDIMTDVFAKLFGTRGVVVSVAHSSISIDGQPNKEGRLYWVALVKDLEQKGFFIRIVDRKEKEVVREKKVGKQFLYDMPGDLVMTFLSEQGITCVGFRDTQEKDRFLHQVDRVIRLQQDQSMKLRGRAETGTSSPKPTQVTHRIKASEFNVAELSAEWKYLFDQAGVSEDMLKDKSTLQFILDTIYEMGGAPEKISPPPPDKEAATTGGVLERERAFALDEKLKKESLRASQLADLLEKQSLKDPVAKTTPTAQKRENICPYLAVCERFKDHLIIKHSLIALGPENASCFCEKCAAGEPEVQTAGSPPQQFTLPIGWTRFVHSSQSHSLARHFCSRWHVAYCCVHPSRVASVVRTGILAHDSHKVKLSPDIKCACQISSVPPQGFHDKASGHHYQVQTVFQVFLQPDTYTVELESKEEAYTVNTEENAEEDSSQKQLQQQQRSHIEWHVTERTYLVHSLWVHMTESTKYEL